MLWELGRKGPAPLLGDQRGRTHLVQVVSGEFTEHTFREPVSVPDLALVRRGVSDVEVPVQRTCHYPQAGLRVECVFADQTWFVRQR